MKRFLSLAAVLFALVFASSCVQEEMGQKPSDEATMTLSLSLPDVATKAYGDGMYEAKNVIIGVFDENGVEKFRKNYVWEKDVFQQEVTIQFVMGKTYQMVLWAQYGNAYGDPKTMSLDEIKLDYQKSNREDLDAFYAYVEPFRVTKDFSKSITLKRPFAQLNFATTVGDMDESIAAGDLGIHNKAQVTIANVANTLDLFTGKTSYVAADGTETASGAAVIIPETEFPKVDGKYPTIKVEETVYEVISMNYVLVADEGAADGKTTVDLKLKVGELEIEVPQANMKRNWRTNVIGELLTGEGTFTVKIDPIFDGTYNENWNDGSDTEDPNAPAVEYSEWKLLGSHNEWASDEFMVLQDGLAVAKGVTFADTKAEGAHEFKVSNGTDWYGMAVSAEVPADSYLAASKADSKNVTVAAGTYDIWFDAAKALIYVMTPDKAITEAKEFKAPETPVEPEDPETETWGIVGSMTEWGSTADIAMVKKTVAEVEYWFADNFVVPAEGKFKFRYVDGNWDDANVIGGGGAAVDQANDGVKPGSDIAPAAGTYDIYLDVENLKYYILTDGKTPADIKTVYETVEFYCVKAADWTNNYLYSWGAYASPAWPGLATEEVVTIAGVEYYKWEVEVNAVFLGGDINVIFNSGMGGVQTVDSPTFKLAKQQYFKTGEADAEGKYAIEQIAAPEVETPEEPEPVVPELALTVAPETVPAEGGKVVATVTSNVAWTLTLGETKVAEGAEAAAQKAVEVTVPANTATEAVTYTLTLSDVPAEGAQAVTATAQFTQAAAQPEEPEQPAGPKVVTVAEFLAAADDTTIEYQVSGTIGDIYQAYNSQYNNISFYIKDATGEMLAYRVSCEGITDPATTITKGDEITVKGTRTLYNNVPQMAQGGVIVAHKDVVIEEPELPESARVISFADKANRTSYTTEQQVWEQDGITVINDKGASTSNVGDYVDPARFYKNSDLKVQSEGMTKIVFECPTSDNNKYLNPLAEVIEGCTVDGGNVIVTFAEPVNEFAVSLTVGQVRVNKIIVYTE